jgi:hypothetical protein
MTMANPVEHKSLKTREICGKAACRLDDDEREKWYGQTHHTIV